MNTMSRILAGGSILAATAGCGSPNPPLMFVDATTFGLRLGNDGATNGGAVSLGYKAQSLAIVPVTYLNERGEVRYLNGRTEDNNRDSMSVFASFQSVSPAKKEADSADSKAGTQTPVVKLGQVFSTGIAAQQITRGYICREDPGNQLCQVQTPTPNKPARSASTDTAGDDVGKKVGNQSEVTTGGLADTSAKRPDEPYQVPLIFARTDVLGIDIGASAVQQGVQFVLGYGNRNLALIPATTKGGDGRRTSIAGKSGDDKPETPDQIDVLSVLGQFSADSETTKLGFGLERYFATGVAARNLGTSLRATIKDSPPAVPKKN